MENRIQQYEKAINELHEAKMIAVQGIFEKEMKRLKRDARIAFFFCGLIIGLIVGWPF